MMERSREERGLARASVPPGVSEAFWRLLLQEPLSDLTVLDVGTGAGRLALALAPLAASVIGIDRDAEAIAAAQARGALLGLSRVEFVVVDAETAEYGAFEPGMVVAHLCMSDAIVARAARALRTGQVLAFVAFHSEQWIETGRPSRFAYSEDKVRQVLMTAGFAVEHLEVERDVRRFGSVEEALAAAIGLQERWRADGRWFRYVKFLEEGGRTLTTSHLIVKARRA